MADAHGFLYQDTQGVSVLITCIVTLGWFGDMLVFIVRNRTFNSSLLLKSISWSASASKADTRNLMFFRKGHWHTKCVVMGIHITYFVKTILWSNPLELIGFVVNGIMSHFSWVVRFRWYLVMSVFTNVWIPMKSWILICVCNLGFLEASSCQDEWSFLTHWGRVTHICVGNLTIIDSDNGLSPGRPQAIIWTNVGILLIGPLRTNFCFCGGKRGKSTHSKKGIW